MMQLFKLRMSWHVFSILTNACTCHLPLMQVRGGTYSAETLRLLSFQTHSVAPLGKAQDISRPAVTHCLSNSLLQVGRAWNITQGRRQGDILKHISKPHQLIQIDVGGVALPYIWECLDTFAKEAHYVAYVQDLILSFMRKVPLYSWDAHSSPPSCGGGPPARSQPPPVKGLSPWQPQNVQKPCQPRQPNNIQRDLPGVPRVLQADLTHP